MRPADPRGAPRRPTVVGPLRRLRLAEHLGRRDAGGVGVIDAAEVPAAIAARAPRAGVFLDLDGTLAPIVPRPSSCREVLPEIPAVLARLARLPRGGRGDLRAAVRSGPRAARRGGVEIVGTHGLEDDDRWPRRSSVRSGPWRRPSAPGSSRRARRPRALPRARGPGGRRVGFVGKSRHDRGDARPRGGPGKRILELAPADGRSEEGGRAVERIARDRQLLAVLFAGDDVGDLDAFAALDRPATRAVDLRDRCRGGPRPSPRSWRRRISSRGPERCLGAARLDRRRAGAPGRGPRDSAAGPRRSPGAGWRATWPGARAPNAGGREPGACAPPPASGAPR